MRMLLKDLNIKSLVTGDKSARVTLETIYPQDIEKLAGLATETEVDVEFKTEVIFNTTAIDSERLAKLGKMTREKLGKP